MQSVIPKGKYITGDELKKRMNVCIEKIVESRKQVITEDDLKNSYSPEEFKTAMKEAVSQIFSKKQ